MLRPVLLLVTLLAVGLSGCVSGQDSDIAVASYPVFYLTDRLAGDDLEVLLLGRPGVSLHDYEPTLRDIDNLRRTELLVLHGLGVEAWAEQALHSLGARAPAHIDVARTAPGDDWLESDHVHRQGTDDGHDDHDDHGHDDHDDHGDGHDDHDLDGIDPHTWLDPLAYLEEARAIRAAIAANWPEHRDAVDARLAVIEQDLLTLDAAYRNGLADCTHSTIVTNHNAYAYMARRYGFDVESLHSVEPGSQPSAATVDQVIRTIQGLGLPVFFLEEGTDPRVVRAVQERTNVELRVLNTLEQPPATGARGVIGYDEVMYENLQHLQFALGCA